MEELPSQPQLLARQQEAQEKLRQLKDAYNEFIIFWQQMESQEKQIIKEIHGQLDTTQVQSILQNIQELK